MKHIALYLICNIFIINILQSQKHDNIWIFGYEPNSPDPGGNLEMNFKITPPEIKKINRHISFYLTCSVCSDSSGNLQFYTNGIEIHNKTGQLMENGFGINSGFFYNSVTIEGGYSAANGAFSIPDPGQENGYLIFHHSYDATLLPDSVDIFIYRVYYSYVDMNANNGYGKVTIKNQLLMEGRFTTPVAVKHANGRDWWVIFCKESDPVHYTFLIDPEGVHGPFTQIIGPDFNPSEILGTSAITPDGNTFIRHDWKAPRIYDFNRCTGQLSNLRIIEYPPGLISWYAFTSPDSKRLYLSNPATMYTVDLQAENPASNFDTLAVYDGAECPYSPWQSTFGIPALGPDNKIYIASVGTTRCLHTIHAPNLPGWACDFEQHGLDLTRWNYGTMNYAPNYRLGKWEGSPCDTINLVNPPDGFTSTLYSVQKKPSQDNYRVFRIPPGNYSTPYGTSMLQYLWKEEQKRKQTFKKNTE